VPVRRRLDERTTSVFSFSLKPLNPAADVHRKREPQDFSNLERGLMMGFITRRRALFALTTALLVVVAGGAYAYFSSTGSGTATATVGSSSAVVLKATVAGNLYPGAAQTVTFTVDNPSTGSQRVNTISLTKVQPDAGHSSCSTTITGENPDFTMAPVTVNKAYGPGNAQAVTPTGSLKMNETLLNQDACQGATLTLTLASN
jgi:hypothetical protein